MRLSVFDADFREDLSYWIEQDRKVALRILRLVEAVLRDPFSGGPIRVLRPIPFVEEGP